MLISYNHLYVTTSFVLLFHAVTWVPYFTNFGPSALQMVKNDHDSVMPNMAPSLNASSLTHHWS
eukprot:12971746-Ditylum_brightwellii.AAC.1